MPNAPRIAEPPVGPRTLNLLVGLIRSYMGLSAEQVVVYNQKWRIPSDNRIYVTVGYLAQKPFGSNVVYENFGVTPQRPRGAGLKEVVSVNSQESITINFYSRGEEAISRKDEPLMALASTACQQLCEANSIKVGQIPVGMNDLSGLDGTARINRFVATINVLVVRSKESIVEYFDQFEATGLVINP